MPRKRRWIYITRKPAAVATVRLGEVIFCLFDVCGVHDKDSDNGYLVNDNDGFVGNGQTTFGIQFREMCLQQRISVEEHIMELPMD